MREIAPGIFEGGTPGILATASPSVTMYQARVALQNAGLLDQVPDAIAALSEPQRTQAQIAWDAKTVVYRDGPLLALIAQQLGLTETQVDDLFATATAVT